MAENIAKAIAAGIQLTLLGAAQLSTGVKVVDQLIFLFDVPDMQYRALEAKNPKR